jgi:hypothetical protein
MKCNNKIENTFNSIDDWMSFKNKWPKYVNYQIEIIKKLYLIID